MQDKQEILLRYYREGDSKSKISRDLGISRRIVRKYIEKYGKGLEGLMNPGVELIEDIVSRPRYDSSNRKKRKLTKSLIDRVKDLLKENEKKRSRGQHKQQLKKIDICDLLQEEGYDISYSSICKLVNELKNKSKECYIKQEYGYGEVCEFDWVESKLFINGELKRLQMAVFTSAKGNYRYSRLFVKQETQSFQQAHGLFFEHIGGVYKELVYDNMRVAVKKFVGPYEKEATEGLLSLSAYYLFRFRFCNVRRGNEKGHVERSGEYIRRKAFGLIDRFETIDQANEHLLSVCEKLNNLPQKGLNDQNAIEILEEEKKYLSPLPPAMFECGSITTSCVDKYSTISIDTCRYSVPEKYVSQVVTTKIYPDKIICYYESEKICQHARRYGFYQWSIQLDHYLKTLRRKPGALKSSCALHQSDEKVKQLYDRHYRHDPKDFIDLIEYIKVSEKKIEEIENAVTDLMKMGSIKVSTDKIKLLCERGEVRDSIDKGGEIESASMNQLIKLSNLIPGNASFGGKVL